MYVYIYIYIYIIYIWLWDGEPISPNNSGKNNDSLEIEPYDFP